MPILMLLRPHQWLKNLMLFFAPFLGGRILQLSPLQALLPFSAFCLAASATYIVNDIADAPRDALHPKKKHRPIASGQVSPRSGAVFAFVFAVVSLFLSLQVGVVFTGIVAGYAILSLLYTFRLKDIAIVDIFCISIFFLLRLMAGGQAFHIHVSDWLFLCVFLLALFLSAGKRLAERDRLGDTAQEHRKSLQCYPDGLLDGIMYMTAAAVLVTYTLYIISKHGVIYTVPLCCFGLIRYMYRVKQGRGGDPTYALLQDPVLFAVGAIWGLMIAFNLYSCAG